MITHFLCTKSEDNYLTIFFKYPRHDISVLKYGLQLRIMQTTHYLFPAYFIQDGHDGSEVVKASSIASS